MDQLLIDLFFAYFSARKNKRNTISALEFELNYEREILKLYQELKDGSYKISKSIVFVIFDPVQREIIASSFRDRIIHHLVFNYINPIFEASFIYDSYSCRKDRGTLFGIKRINKFIRSCSDNYKKEAYILKLDISGYFMNINKEILWNKIEKILLKNKNKCNFDFSLITSLVRRIIFHNYTKNYSIRGKKSDWDGLPKNKSLFLAEENKGLPIGNLTSQLFSNIYLNSFDNFIKRNLKFKYYGRYVDDFIIIHKDKEFLKEVVKVIKKYLEVNLNLKINNKKIYFQECYKGFKFLGAIVKPFRVYINNRTKNNFYIKIGEINNIVKNNDISVKKNMILSSLNSYLGIMKHYNTYNLRKKILTTKFHINFFNFFEIDKNREDCYLKIVKKQ
ncbi:MAG: reverse transcriptase domain-containing protein [Patescibacteria group bacterium]|nr:reverse transcriptase domain-containing protein [Patescibacteria group bacterium]